jgi:hypothetical protein
MYKCIITIDKVRKAHQGQIDLHDYEIISTHIDDGFTCGYGDMNTFSHTQDQGSEIV